MLLQRVLTAVVGIPAALLLIYVGSWYLAAAVSLLAVVGLRELYRLLAARGRSAYPWLGYPLAVALTAVAARSNLQTTASSLRLESALLVAAMAIAAWWMLSPSPRPVAMKLFATLAGHVYVPQLLSYLVRLRAFDAAPITPRGIDHPIPAGACLLSLLMAVVWGMDTAAYGIGKTLGRRKLCPGISPGKTVEGAVAAFATAVGLTAAFAYWFSLPGHHGLVLGGAVGVLGQVGDLFKSCLKRRAGVKDSGNVLPGHGGVLDRFDSLLFTAPLAYFYLTFVLP